MQRTGVVNSRTNLAAKLNDSFRSSARPVVANINKQSTRRLDETAIWNNSDLNTS